MSTVGNLRVSRGCGKEPPCSLNLGGGGGIGFRASSLGLRVWGLGLWVWGLGLGGGAGVYAPTLKVFRVEERVDGGSR